MTRMLQMAPATRLRRALKTGAALLVLAGVFLVAPSLNGFDLSAGQQKAGPDTAVRDANELAAGEVGRLLSRP